MRYIALFENLTGAIAKDCVIDNSMGRIIFVVRPGDMGLAIGRNGANIQRLRSILGKQVEVVEYADNPELFIKNLFAPAKVKAIKITKMPDGRKVAYVSVEAKDKGLAIGKNGKNIARARFLAKRHFDIDHISVI